MLKLALTGRMRSGKDTVANYLAEHYGFVKFAFGDELKRYAHELFDVPYGSKPRELYQWFGQTMRQRDPEIWVRKLVQALDEYENTPDIEPKRAVVTDLRQPNEYARLRAEGFVIIRVLARDETRIERMRAAGDAFAPEDLAHETEQYVDSFAVDYEIDNNGSLAELYAQVDVIMREIITRSEGTK